MTLWTELFLVRHLIKRSFYSTPGISTAVVPARATIMRIMGVGAGGWAYAAYGYGAAYAFKKTTCTAGESLSLQVGDPHNTYLAGDSLGDTTITRVTGGVLLLKAQRGGGSVAGLAANSVGDIKRDGGAPNSYAGGAPGGDESDPYPLGFGGRGVTWRTSTRLQPSHGGGGISQEVIVSGLDQISQSPGGGRICLEFFDADPGY